VSKKRDDLSLSKAKILILSAMKNFKEGLSLAKKKIADIIGEVLRRRRVQSQSSGDQEID
jgi:hypothetical protein